MRMHLRVKRDAGHHKMVVRNVRNIVMYRLSVNLAKDDDSFMRKNVRVERDAGCLKMVVGM